MTTTECPIDRFARLMADIRRTHPVTAGQLHTRYAYVNTSDRDWWLDTYLPQLEREWAAGDGRAATGEGEG